MIIGIAGKMKSGKDTAAEALVNIGFTKIAFADHLKSVCMHLFDMTHDQVYTLEGKETIDLRYGRTPREILQFMGTEVVRDNFPNLWVQHMWRACEGIENIVIPDVRFDNEAAFVALNEGVMIEIERPRLQKKGPLAWIKEKIGHRSERGVNRQLLDYIVINDSSISDLHEQILDILEENK